MVKHHDQGNIYKRVYLSLSFVRSYGDVNVTIVNMKDRGKLELDNTIYSKSLPSVTYF